jgi:peptide/nickel transport system substrate-binding protein
MRRSRVVGAMALLAGAVVVLSSCSSGSSGDSNGAASGPSNSDPQALALSQPYHRPKVPDAGAITVAVDETSTDYNNNLGSTANIANTYIFQNVQPSVFFTNDVNNVTKVQMDGDLMSSVKQTSSSPQTIEYNFNPKAVWQDGAPVGCSDIYLQWLSGENGLPSDVLKEFNNALTGLDHIKSVTCSNNGKTATVVFSPNWADWQGQFANLMPAHVLEKATGVPDITKVTPTTDKATLLKIADFYSGGPSSNKPGFAGLNLQYDLSAGPYMLQSANGKDETVLVRNPKWWGATPGPSKLDVRTNSDDQSAFQQLQNKEINVAGGQPDAQVALQVKAAGDPYKLITGIGVTYEHLDYQLKNPYFVKYPEMRTALSQCVNRGDIINKVVADVDPAIKPLGNVWLLPTESGYVNDYPNTGNGDSAAAKQTLQSKGWTMGPDGFFHKGTDIATVTIGHKTNDRRENTVKAIQAECKAAGIQVQDYTSDSFNANDLPAGNYQVALFAWTGTPFKSGLDAIYQTNANGNGGENWQGFTNPQVDNLIKQADGELDYAKRLSDYQQVDKLIAKADSTLPLFTLPEYAVTDGSVMSTDQSGTKIQLQDNEASGAIMWDAFAWQKASQ